MRTQGARPVEYAVEHLHVVNLRAASMPGQVVCTLNVRSSYFVMVNTHRQAERETAESVECDFVDVLWQAGEDASIPSRASAMGSGAPERPQPRRRPEESMFSSLILSSSGPFFKQVLCGNQTDLPQLRAAIPLPRGDERCSQAHPWQLYPFFLGAAPRRIRRLFPHRSPGSTPLDTRQGIALAMPTQPIRTQGLRRGGRTRPDHLRPRPTAQTCRSTAHRATP